MTLLYIPNFLFIPLYNSIKLNIEITYGLVLLYFRIVRKALQNLQYEENVLYLVG